MNETKHETEVELVDELNSEMQEEIKLGPSLGPISVSSRDWTVETILSQIKSENINLNPAFQRRNAWNDVKRSRLIESLIWGIPVPQIVLAEDKAKPKSFIVIDGKQRLLTIAGFFDPSIKYWNDAKLKSLEQFSELNGLAAENIISDNSIKDISRNLLNADIRCTIISSYQSDDILYEIFLRMNTGSTQLSTQELRQVLCKGWLADWLIATTSSHQPIHEILGIQDSDLRLVDVEILLRCICTDLFLATYRGNMKAFLDNGMRDVTRTYTRPKIEQVYQRINFGIENLLKVMAADEIGRKPSKGLFEKRFNRALFEVEQYYFSRLPKPPQKKFATAFKSEFSKWFDLNPEFREATESTTKSIDRTKTRFSAFGKFFNSFWKTNVDVPL